MVAISNMSMEVAMVGALAKNLDLFEDIQIKSNYDFNDLDARFLYDELEVFYHKHASMTDKTELTENKFNLYISCYPEKLARYRQMGGFKTIHSLMEKANECDFKMYYEEIKKYSLLRQLETKGFIVAPIMADKNFAKFTAQDVLNIYHHNLNKIYMNTINGNDIVLAGDKLQEQIDSYLDAPKYGMNISDFSILSDSFLGMSKKQLFAFSGLSNFGKTRTMIYILSNVAFYQGYRIGLVLNETSLEEARLCLLTVVCNNPIYGFDLHIEERRLALGDYKEGEYEKVVEAIKYIEEKSNFYLYEITDLRDESLERSFKKMSNIFKCDVVVYDTFKSTSGDYSDLVKTSVMFKTLANTLNICIIVNLQLTDDSINVAPEDMSSMQIASAKHIKHSLDGLLFEKAIKSNEYSKYMIYHKEFGTYALDKDTQYFAMVVDKNRRGKKLKLIYSYNLDFMTIKEEGYLVRSTEK